MIELNGRQASTIDDLIGPEDKIIYRCMDCQNFMLPAQIHLMMIRYRDLHAGEGRTVPFEICPFCYPTMEKVDDFMKIPESHFVTLTRHDYEQTKLAEKWGMTYDEKTKEMKSKLLVH